MIKAKLRSKVLKIRKDYSNKSIQINPDKIYFFLKKNYKIKSIGGYYPTNNEIDDIDILNFFEKKGSAISLPMIAKNNQMDFFRWSKDDPIKINKYVIHTIQCQL